MSSFVQFKFRATTVYDTVNIDLMQSLEMNLMHAMIAILSFPVLIRSSSTVITSALLS